MNNRHQPRPSRHPNNHRPNGQAPPGKGSVVFRMLCHVEAVGGVIGSSGAIVKQLEAQTGCKIQLEKLLPGCLERVVNIIGDGTIDRNIKLTSDGGEFLEMEISGAQMGLLRVLDRVLKPQRGENCCRLLAGMGKVGGVMGKGGVIVMEIQQNSGARIWVLPKDQIPSCAAPHEELIQIVGDEMAVKKALVAVSHCLQVCSPLERKRSHLPPPQTEFQDRLAGFHEDCNPVPPSVSGSSSVGITLSEDMESILRLDKRIGQKRVVFKLLCSNSCAGGVIGKGASVVNKIQQETGAYVKFSPPAAGFKERVATISSLENQDSLHSPAQNATVLVFARCVEIDIENKYLVDLGAGVSVIARILVTPDEINCLIDGKGGIALDISESSSVGIQLLEMNSIPNCTTASHKLVQIVGEFETVKSALFQVTGKLRKGFFSSKTTGEAGLRQQSNSTQPINTPHGKCMSPKKDNSQEHPFANPINDLGNVKDRPRLPHEMFKEVRKTRNLVVGEQNLTEGPTSEDTEAMLMRTVEVFVPEVSFANVYGENGNNLTRMREISGAKVMVEDPSPGGSDGRVIISGTPERIFIAQSLLQAFIRE